jgi:uncharacterized SAM-binding protein YcdF (DUF218 family)
VKILRRVAILVCLVAAAIAGVTGYFTFRIWEQGSRDDARPADAIVVLGAAQYNGTPSPVFLARLDHALELYRRGLAPQIVLTGGRSEGDRTTEAAAGRAYLVAAGVPEPALLAEDQGRTTRESIDNVRDLFAAHGLKSAVFVSDPTHLYRVLLLASDDGITGWGSPATGSPVGHDPQSWITAVVHELGALAEYFGGTIGRTNLPASATPSPGPSA